jgi:hypothetical protein
MWHQSHPRHTRKIELKRIETALPVPIVAKKYFNSYHPPNKPGFAALSFALACRYYCYAQGDSDGLNSAI